MKRERKGKKQNVKLETTLTRQKRLMRKEGKKEKKGEKKDGNKKRKEKK